MSHDASTGWTNTTHDWSVDVDLGHLAMIRRDPHTFAPGGLPHLILEVLAYPLDEALDAGSGSCVVTFHNDGSVSVGDDGRGTDTRVEARGRTIRKPVMATRDLRFFDSAVYLLPDGHPRRGMSVVAALSEYLIHTNRRLDGSWTQRYERGVPTTDLIPIDEVGSTGTTVRFLADASLVRNSEVTTEEFSALTDLLDPRLRIETIDERL